MNERTPIDTAVRWERAAFRQQENIRRAFDWMVKDPDTLDSRVKDFDYTLDRINAGLNHGRLGYEGSLYLISTPPHVRDLRTTLENSPDYKKGSILPSIEEIINNNNPYYKACVIETFQDAERDFPEWANKQFRHPFAVASAILLESYGMFIGKLYDGASEKRSKKIRQNFVLGAEEILLREKTTSPLLNDLSYWMKEDIEMFSLEDQETIKMCFPEMFWWVKRRDWRRLGMSKTEGDIKRP